MNELFDRALSIQVPWFVDRVEFDPEHKKLDIFIDFERGSVFPCYEPGHEGEYKVYDTKDKTWRHLNFFEHECYLHCRTPRIKIGENKIIQVSPPWAGLNSGFTLLFEALILQLCSNMPVQTVAKIINEHDDKLWRLLNKYVESARKTEDFAKVTKLGLDETSQKKGHNYITLFVDLDKNKTIFVTEGKNHETVRKFAEDLKEHNGTTEQISDVSCDMSPAFIKGVHETFPEARITFDKFHVAKLINEAVDQVRREESAHEPLLRKTRYIFLKNNENLTSKQREKLEEVSLPRLNLKSVRALHIRENFQAIYNAQTQQEFETLMKKWYFWATHSRLEPVINAAKTIKTHWNGIIEWKRSQINNGILEGLNSVIQAAKAKARGFSSFRNFKIIAYLTTGNLNFNKLNPYTQKHTI